MVSSVVSPSVTVGSSLPESVTSVPASGDSVITWMLQSLLPRTSTALGERVLIGNGLPCIPKKLVDKIRSWEFVELSDLLPSSNPMDASVSSGTPTARFSLFPGCEVVRHRKRQIANIMD